MVKKIGYVFLTLVVILAITIGFGSRYFNNMWFKEKPNYLTFTTDGQPINFQWTEGNYEDYIEPHEAIIIPVKIEGIPNQLYFQFDTGTPSTLIYGKTLKSLQEHYLDINEVVKDDKKYVEDLDFTLGGSKINASMIQVLEGYGSSFDKSDSLTTRRIGSIGADFLVNQITSIDFKDQTIQLFDERPEWMASLPNFESFDFKGRRFMLPAIIDNKEYALFYDSGSSAFGIITTRDRFNKYTDESTKEIEYSANSWGDAIPIHHKATNMTMTMGGNNLELKRVSYVDMYAGIQKFTTPLTSIGGWLGNKPFTESTLILDTKVEEFVVLNP